MDDVFAGQFWPSPEVRLRVVRGEAILLDLASEEIFRLNETGSRIWQLLNEHHDPEIVQEALLKELDVDMSVLRNDLAELLNQLLEASLITNEDPSEASS